jgi:hypothetical protein
MHVSSMEVNVDELRSCVKASSSSSSSRMSCSTSNLRVVVGGKEVGIRGLRSEYKVYTCSH